MSEHTKSKKTAAIFILIVAVLCLIGLLWQRFFWFDLSLKETVSAAGVRYGVDESLIFAVIKAESNFNKRAVSPKGARGLMQIMPSTALFAAENMGIEEIMPDDAGQNISMGAWYLAYLAEKFGDERAVIAAYNAGENTVSGWLARGAMPDDIPYAETKNYVGKVEFFKNVYAALYK